MIILVLVTATGALAQSTVVQKQELASGSFVVYAPSPQIWRVKVDPATMSNAIISGSFTVSEGTPKNIDVLVFNEENYTKWKDEDPAVRNGATPLASALHMNQGDINAKLTDAGYHYLVVSNRYQYEGKKTISANIKFQYDKR